MAALIASGYETFAQACKYGQGEDGDSKKTMEGGELGGGGGGSEEEREMRW